MSQKSPFMQTNKKLRSYWVNRVQSFFIFNTYISHSAVYQVLRQNNSVLNTLESCSNFDEFLLIT